MCNSTCEIFAATHIHSEDVRGKRVLEVGSRNINGSIRNHIESLQPDEYIGVDIAPGPGVDIICGIIELDSRFGGASFDLVICTEVIEHVLDWVDAMTNLRRVLRCGGKLLVTTRSKGFPYHGFQFDYWRFELSDFEHIFSDMDIISLVKDQLDPGVLVVVRKNSESADAQAPVLRPLYSMLTRTHTSHLTLIDRLKGVATNFQLMGFLSAVLPNTVKRPLKRIFRYGSYDR
jgi:SAM-dependent methyltransferase